MKSLRSKEYPADPGCAEASPIPRHVLELAQELYAIIEAIESYGHGEGQITLKVQPGRTIPFIDWTFRTFRGKKHSD